MTEKDEKWLEKKISRRHMLKITGASAAGAAVLASGMGGVAKAFGFDILDDDQTAENKVLFYGKHQSGITTDTTTHIYFASLNVLVESQSELQDLFKMWTPLAVRLMNGERLEESSQGVFTPPKDTGESAGLDAANLTVTFGVGPSLFDNNKLGLGSKRPTELTELPHFPKDQIDDKFAGGDICIQACADDPQVAFHAVRNLVRAATGKVTLKWTQTGFTSTPKVKDKKETPRNLFAFKDGTVNPSPKSAADMKEVVWVQPNESTGWMTNGTYLVVRKIQMHLETWDRTSLQGQEATFGRHRDSGAPIGKKKEFDEVDLNAKDASGNPHIPADSHMALARKVKDQILRRGFSYSSGLIDETGAYDAGLLFISFQKNPKQFINIQNALGRADKLNEYITHRGSGIFACFPGIQKGSYIGEKLFNVL
ncbi:iron uptake transporter deferrochelatase/peroxidase subunit [Planococcus kocurii]|uniref:iron uptake transporter deferrochelatase/peroxidase subunit n=1 Tax=Planococcus kocurii TaxID=1374 RepID=UPI003D009B26